NGLAFSADGRLLAAAYRRSGVVVWDVSGGPTKLRCPLRGSTGAYGVAFSGATLAVAGGDRAVHLLNLSLDGCPAVTPVFRRSDIVFGVAFSPDGKLLAAASGDGTVAVWNIDSPENPLLDHKFSKPMYAVAFSPDGSTLAAADSYGNAYFWD